MKLFQYAVCIVLLGFSALAQTPKPGNPYQKEATVSETKGVVHISANSPRPLEQVLDALQLKYGWLVGYEDPQYSPQDLTDSPGGAQLQLPNGGSFSVEFPSSSPDEEKTLRLIVDFYNHSKNPGQFEVRRGPENVFFVVGVGAHDAKGGISQQAPPLDAAVTVSSDNRSLTDTLDLLCQEITKQSHTDVQVAVSPRSLLSKTSMKIGGNKIQARELLIQILAASHHKLYWRLLYDPSSKGFLLNVHSLRTPS